ncbi:hypothetical protein CLOM_g6227 [Closterium sp. NIES-68]|nr:hypothetical protein CLOM_g6227 [Closterium sp. NIES-68]
MDASIMLTGPLWYQQQIRIHPGQIDVQSAEPEYQRRRRMSPGDMDIAEAKCRELLAAGLMRESTSGYAAATVVAARKDLTGEMLARQMCGDYCRLNRITKSDRYPMPMAEEIFDKLAEGKVYSTLDLRQGLNQIPIKEEDKPKTAFHGPDRLHFDLGGVGHLWVTHPQTTLSSPQDPAGSHVASGDSREIRQNLAQHRAGWIQPIGCDFRSLRLVGYFTGSTRTWAPPEARPTGPQMSPAFATSV